MSRSPSTCVPICATTLLLPRGRVSACAASACAALAIESGQIERQRNSPGLIARPSRPPTTAPKPKPAPAPRIAALLQSPSHQPVAHTIKKPPARMPLPIAAEPAALPSRARRSMRETSSKRTFWRPRDAAVSPCKKVTRPSTATESPWIRKYQLPRFARSTIRRGLMESYCCAASGAAWSVNRTNAMRFIHKARGVHVVLQFDDGCNHRSTTQRGES